MSELPPVHVSSPGEIIRDEMEARNLTRCQLADRLGINCFAVGDLICGETRITPDLAERLSVVFNTSTDLWISLESNYRKHLLETSHD